MIIYSKEGKTLMGVTFYDPSNLSQYDNEYNYIGGGPEVSFSNVNARNILDILGLLRDDQELHGEISAEDLISIITRTKVAIDWFCNYEKCQKDYLLEAFLLIEEVANESLSHSKRVCWG